MHEGSITIRIPADVKEIERMNRLVRCFGELHEIPGRALYSINLALDEIVSNAILYGFDSPEAGARGEIVVRVSLEGGELRAVVEDGARAFDPLSVPSPDLSAPLEQRQIGGLGVHLVRSLMDRVEYRRDGAKNLLSLQKRIR